jgi:GTP-dependent phosphoenolpyruvate carboxykinase
MNTATQTIKVYDEIIELIARGTTPQSVINFHLSDTAQNRLEDLIYNSKNNELTQDEKQELNSYLMLEHIMTLARAKAHQYLNGAN